MGKVLRYVSILALAALLAPLARAAGDEVPNINNRGDDEKKFVEKLVNTIVPAARTSVKSATLTRYEKKEPKPGRTDFHITAGYKGAITKKDHSADIVVHCDTSNPKKWEVMRIDYKDDSPSPLGASKKNLDALRDKLNARK
jgi:hypothetical protein